MLAGIDYNWQPSFEGVDEHLDTVAEHQLEKAKKTLATIAIVYSGDTLVLGSQSQHLAQSRYDIAAKNEHAYTVWLAQNLEPEHRAPDTYEGLPFVTSV